MEETYRILAEGRTVSNNTRLTGLNNNDLIIGPSGSGYYFGKSTFPDEAKGFLCQSARSYAC